MPNRRRGKREDIALLILAVVAGFIIVFLVGEWNNNNARQIVGQHLPAVIGLPLAGLFAFIVIAVFRGSEGQIQFEIFGSKFSGAAGETTMWIFCFLAIVGSIWLLWPINP
jgi:hypothetical protein